MTIRTACTTLLAAVVVFAAALLATPAAPAQAAPPTLGLFEIQGTVFARHGRDYRGRCLDVEDASFAHAAPVLVQYCSGGINQKWRLVAAQASLPGYWEIRALHSGKCLDVAHRSFVDYAGILQGTCVRGANQTWRILPRGNDTYELRARHSNLCAGVLALPGRIPRLVQRTCPEAAAWRFQPTSR